MMASSGRLKQGEKGVISARVSTAGKSGCVSETITVRSNDPKRPKVVLTLSAIIVETMQSPAAMPLCK